MLRIFLGLFILTSCSSSKVSGGKHRYLYQYQTDYSQNELQELSSQVVETLKRDAPEIKVDDLFSADKRDLKRIGIVIFESQIQSTRGGLAGQNKVYLSAQGKQLWTERLLNVWEKSLPIIAPGIDYVATSKIKKSPVFANSGLEVDDHVKVAREGLAPDDIFYLDAGKETTLFSVMNPRGMRDISIFLVPAYELMAGPKWSEHGKQYVNDLAKNLGLDAVIIVMNEIDWTRAHTDKHSGEHFAEEAKVSLKASVLIPLSQYRERLKSAGKSNSLDINACFRAYETTLKIPLRLDVPKEEESFETIEKELITPVMKTYKDVVQMTIMRMDSDLKKTY